MSNDADLANDVDSTPIADPSASEFVIRELVAARTEPDETLAPDLAWNVARNPTASAHRPATCRGS